MVMVMGLSMSMLFEIVDDGRLVSPSAIYCSNQDVR
jgi:hypothetical protein